MRMPMLRAFLVSLAATAFSGCTALGVLDRAAVPLDVYELRAPDAAPVARGQQGIHFIVEVPSAGGAIDTDRILIRPAPSQVTYLPEGRWSEAAPVMLQTAMMETFLRANAFRFVGRRPLGAAGDVALVSNLTDFGAEVVPGTDGAVVEMTLIARLVREDDAEVVASRTFTRAVTVPGTSTPAIIAGFEAVSDAVLSDLAGWVLGVRGIAAGAS